MDEFLSRAQLLLGEEAITRLANAKVAVFGIGGVGGYCVEALARGGIGSLSLYDPDRIGKSNLNRQIIATQRTLGEYKVNAMKSRIIEINPDAEVQAIPLFFEESCAGDVDFSAFDYIVDAVDTVSAKIALAVQAQSSKTPLISCMGAGNKLDPTRFEVADLYETSVCPLAKVMRRELRKRGIPSLKVVYSREETRSPVDIALAEEMKRQSGKRQTPGSVSFVPAVAGLILAGEVIKDIACIK